MSNNGIWGNPLDKERFARATEINVNDAGNTLMQKFVNRTVQMLQIRELGMLTILERRAGSGKSEVINQRAAQSVGNSGGWVADTAAGVTIVGNYSQKEFDYKTYLTRGAVTRKMQAIGRSYMDLLALEMAAKAEDFANGLDYGIIYGTFGATAGDQPMGLITLCENANAAAGAAQDTDGPHIINQAQYYTNTTGFVSATGSASSFGAAYPFTLEALDETIDAIKGSSNRSDLAIVASYQAMRQLNAALQAQQRFVDETEIDAGFRVRTYDGIPLIVDSNALDTLKFAGNTTSGISGHITNLTGGIGTQFLVLNRRYVYLAELTPTTVLPLSKTTSQVDYFDMYWDGAPVIANDYGFAILSGVSSTGVFSNNV